MAQKIYFVGTHAEVAHHAAPIKESMPLEIVSISEVIEKATRGDLAIFFSEHFDRFRDCVVQLKSKNVATLYMIDGILEWRNAWENRKDEPACPWTMRPALAHKVACIGPSQVAMLNSWGNTAKSELVGVPRFDYYSRDMNDHVVKPDPTRRDFRLLIMSAKCPGFTPEQIEKTVAGFAALKSWLSNNPRMNGRKIVPVWRLTGNLSERLEIENHCKDLSGMELKETLVDIDAVVTTPSTAMLEAMLLDRPVALLDFNNSPHLVPAAWRITAETQIKETLRNWPPLLPQKFSCKHTCCGLDYWIPKTQLAVSSNWQNGCWRRSTLNRINRSSFPLTCWVICESRLKTISICRSCILTFPNSLRPIPSSCKANWLIPDGRSNICNVRLTNYIRN